MMTDYFKMTTDARSNEQAVLREKSIRLNAIRSYNRHQEAIASSNEGKVFGNDLLQVNHSPLTRLRPSNGIGFSSATNR